MNLKNKIDRLKCDLSSIEEHLIDETLISDKELIPLLKEEYYRYSCELSGLYRIQSFFVKFESFINQIILPVLNSLGKSSKKLEYKVIFQKTKTEYPVSDPYIGFQIFNRENEMLTNEFQMVLKTSPIFEFVGISIMISEDYKTTKQIYSKGFPIDILNSEVIETIINESIINNFEVEENKPTIQ